jgi:telomerase reverse transcriptase
MSKEMYTLVLDTIVSILEPYLEIANQIDLLNRRPLETKPSDGNDLQENAHNRSTVEVMMYIFPRQFGLHNVFTEEVDQKQTMQPFQDYTLRNDDIDMKFGHDKMPKIPRRLRGKAIQLARQLQINHRRCPYKILLDHYCPVCTNPF